MKEKKSIFRKSEKHRPLSTLAWIVNNNEKYKNITLNNGLICADPENFIGGRGCFPGERGGGSETYFKFKKFEFSRSAHGHTKFQYLDPNELLPTPTMNN